MKKWQKNTVITISVLFALAALAWIYINGTIMLYEKYGVYAVAVALISGTIIGTLFTPMTLALLGSNTRAELEEKIFMLDKKAKSYQEILEHEIKSHETTSSNLKSTWLLYTHLENKAKDLETNLKKKQDELSFKCEIISNLERAAQKESEMKNQLIREIEYFKDKSVELAHKIEKILQENLRISEQRLKLIGGLEELQKIIQAYDGMYPWNEETVSHKIDEILGDFIDAHTDQLKPVA